MQKLINQNVLKFYLGTFWLQIIKNYEIVNFYHKSINKRYTII